MVLTVTAILLSFDFRLWAKTATPPPSTVKEHRQAGWL
ncbi:hypothetical protein JCM19237_3950 [Photobacterium aphoticum]|uniref:Uncharacterized protein n=1 Tax=Photobacterium aphoticum TaxID=754436 RepID=A0A090QYE0_9GAMM|nr:hypothetical protein JCM19237_3950 [Photobacterium aphoticum]